MENQNTFFVIIILKAQHPTMYWSTIWQHFVVELLLKWNTYVSIYHWHSFTTIPFMLHEYSEFSPTDTHVLLWTPCYCRHYITISISDLYEISYENRPRYSGLFSPTAKGATATTTTTSPPTNRDLTHFGSKKYFPLSLYTLRHTTLFNSTKNHF